MYTIYGNLPRKSNSRRLVYSRGKPLFIKSEKALQYEKDFLNQMTHVEPLQGPICLKAVVWYSSRRPDLSDELLCDLIEKSGLVDNDRQIFEKHLYKKLDPQNPRVEFSLTPIEESSLPQGVAELTPQSTDS